MVEFRGKERDSMEFSNLERTTIVPKNHFVSFMERFRKLCDGFVFDGRFVSTDRFLFETVRFRVVNGSSGITNESILNYPGRLFFPNGRLLKLNQSHCRMDKSTFAK